MLKMGRRQDNGNVSLEPPADAVGALIEPVSNIAPTIHELKSMHLANDQASTRSGRVGRSKELITQALAPHVYPEIQLLFDPSSRLRKAFSAFEAKCNKFVKQLRLRIVASSVV